MRAFRAFAPLSLKPSRAFTQLNKLQLRQPLATMASPSTSAPPNEAQAEASNGADSRPEKRNFPQQGGNNSKRGKWNPKKTKREKNITKGSSEDILRLDIQALIKARGAEFSTAPISESQADTDVQKEGDESLFTEDNLPKEGTETDVQVLDVSSTGEGLAMKAGSDQVYVIPFVVAGDIARVKVFRHLRQDKHTIADFISITKPSPLRDDSRIRCRYFSQCGGCQFQMLSYDEQLNHKKRVLVKAYQNFSDLDPSIVPQVRDTIGSPLQYGYRTKLTPHFDGPKNNKRRNREPFESCPDIGFMLKGKRRVMDIEECPIGTEAVNIGMKDERKRMTQEFGNYKRGATLLLRENTNRHAKDSPSAPKDDSELPPSTARTETGNFIDVKSCVTDSKATTTEYIDSYTFTNPAGSFFQNNNSILPKFTSYIREHILPPPSTTAKPIKYLIDAYSGSGLFTITLSSVFQHSIGIDIAADSIACARRNAELNGLGEDRCSFIAADAGELFKSVTYEADETVVVLDPPRKGCDGDFLAQLRKFGPKRVVYVSCNVHTQARDVGILVAGEGEGSKYDIESIRGFDFFPQTGHVEGVAILNRVDTV